MKLSKQDPILEVTGVSAVEILNRCTRIRAANVETPRLRTLLKDELVSNHGKKKSWKLSQFSKGNNEEFVRLAYIALFGRPATEKEITKRIRQLSSGTRLGILARLLSSPESRRYNPKVRGVMLKSLKKLSRYRHTIANEIWFTVIIRGVKKAISKII